MQIDDNIKQRKSITRGHPADSAIWDRTVKGLFAIERIKLQHFIKINMDIGVVFCREGNVKLLCTTKTRRIA